MVRLGLIEVQRCSKVVLFPVRVGFNIVSEESTTYSWGSSTLSFGAFGSLHFRGETFRILVITFFLNLPKATHEG